jgi:hypothetical protein
MNAPVYLYFSKGVQLPNEDGTNNSDNYLYTCHECKRLKKAKTTFSSHGSSNLIKHLRSKGHESIIDEFEEKEKAFNAKQNPTNKKRKLEAASTQSPHSLFGKVSTSNKYSVNSLLQQKRY